MAAAADRPLHSKKILVVEGNVDIADLISINLSRENYEIKCVFSGYEALDMAERIKPDLILLDIMLPDERGFEICKILKKNQITENIPIIMVTAKEVKVKGKRVDLTLSEFRLLQVLAQKAGRVNSRSQLIAAPPPTTFFLHEEVSYGTATAMPFF